MDELDTQLAAELSAQEKATEPVIEPVAEVEPQAPVEEPKAEEPKFDYVKELGKVRREAAAARIEARTEREARQNLERQYGQPQAGYPQEQQGQPQGPQTYYDPRVDDMILANKMTEIKADPNFSELFNEVDDEGRTFEEKLLEKAVDSQWPIAELDALALKMNKLKLFSKIKQKGIDEAYKSMSSKAQAVPERNVSSGAKVEEGEVKTIDDAVDKALKSHGVTDITQLR